MIKTALFDFDGVIANSLESYFRWFTYAASIFQVELTVATAKELKENFIEPFPNLYTYLGFDWEKDKNQIFEEYIHYFTQTHPILVDGIKPVIEELSDDPNMNIGIVSSNEREVLKSNLEFHGLTHCFDVVIGCDKQLKIPLKPDPTSLLTALDILGASLSKSIYIGDQPSDVLTAVNASNQRNSGRIKTISITTGFASREKLETTPPTADHIVDHPAEILKILIRDDTQKIPPNPLNKTESHL
jgi:pyrophosphatase PpaX